MTDHFLRDLFSVLTHDVWEFPNLVVSNLVVFNFYAEAGGVQVFMRKRSFALFCNFCVLLPLFCGLAFSLVYAHLRSFARICVFLRQRLGTADGCPKDHSILKILRQ